VALASLSSEPIISIVHKPVRLRSYGNFLFSIRRLKADASPSTFGKNCFRVDTVLCANCFPGGICNIKNPKGRLGKKKESLQLGSEPGADSTQTEGGRTSRSPRDKGWNSYTSARTFLCFKATGSSPKPTRPATIKTEIEGEVKGNMSTTVAVIAGPGRYCCGELRDLLDRWRRGRTGVSGDRYPKAGGRVHFRRDTYLLWNGILSNQLALREFSTSFGLALDKRIIHDTQSLPASANGVLRTAVSALSFCDADEETIPHGSGVARELPQPDRADRHDRGASTTGSGGRARRLFRRIVRWYSASHLVDAGHPKPSETATHLPDIALVLRRPGASTFAARVIYRHALLTFTPPLPGAIAGAAEGSAAGAPTRA